MNFSPQSHKGHEEHKEDFVLSDLARENHVAKQAVDCAFKVHKLLGPGLLESAYVECLAKEFSKRTIAFKREHLMPIFYEGEKIHTPYKIDFLVDGCVILELKSVEKLIPVHEAQTLTYLKLSNLRLALLINFTAPLIKDGIKRFVL